MDEILNGEIAKSLIQMPDLLLSCGRYTRKSIQTFEMG